MAINFPGITLGQPKPALPGDFGPLSQQFNSGYSLSYSGGDKDRLMGDEAYGSQDFPDFMRQGAPVGGLRNLRQNLGQYFDFNPIQQSFDTMQQGQMSAAKAAAGSAARAATNRAMISGGQVGADFARASALQPFFRQQAAQNLDVQGLRSQMAQNQAQLSGQLAGQIAALRAQRQTNRQNYAVDAARLGQKNIGISGSVGYGQGQGAPNNKVVDTGDAGYGMGPGQYTPGYIPNSGAITPMTIGGVAQPFRAMVGAGAANTGMGIPFRTSRT